MPLWQRSKKIKRAFTLLELLVTLVVVGILAGLALPLFPKALESTRAKEAEAALRQIRAAERIYRTKEGYYYPHHTDAVNNPETDVATINSFLKLFLDTQGKNWTYQVGTSALNQFTATATRTGTGGNSGETITLNQDGTQGGDWSP